MVRSLDATGPDRLTLVKMEKNWSNSNANSLYFIHEAKVKTREHNNGHS